MSKELNIFELADLFQDEVMIVSKAERKMIEELRDSQRYTVCKTNWKEEK